MSYEYKFSLNDTEVTLEVLQLFVSCTASDKKDAILVLKMLINLLGDKQQHAGPEVVDDIQRRKS